MTPEKVREAIHNILGHNAQQVLADPAPPPPTITQQPHWLNKKWEYIPSSDHADASKFKERMEKRRKAVQQP
jgi:hypothetical protein